MVVHEKSMTVEEFWAVYAGQPYELVEGRIVEVTPAGFSHGTITSRAAALLRAFVDAHGLGEVVGAETGFWLNEHTAACTRLRLCAAGETRIHHGGG